MVSTVLSWVPIAEQVDRPQPSLISPYSASLLAFRSGFRLDKLSVWGRFPWLSVMIAISKMEVYKKVGEDYRCVLPPPCMLGSSIGKCGEIFFFLLLAPTAKTAIKFSNTRWHSCTSETSILSALEPSS